MRKLISILLLLCIVVGVKASDMVCRVKYGYLKKGAFYGRYGSFLPYEFRKGWHEMPYVMDNTLVEIDYKPISNAYNHTEKGSVLSSLFSSPDYDYTDYTSDYDY